MLDLKNLKIISKESVAPTSESQTSLVELTKQGNDEKIKNMYKLVQSGSIQEKDFKKSLFKTHPKMLSKISIGTRNNLSWKLKELIKLYLDIKCLLMGFPENNSDLNFKNNSSENIVRFYELKASLDTFLNTERMDKQQSLILKEIISLFVYDNPVKPEFGVSDYLINTIVKTERNESLIKEITLCFSMYRKYLNTLAIDFNKAFEDEKEIETLTETHIEKDIDFTFRNIQDIQPRFQMVINHIKKTNDPILIKSKFGFKDLNSLNLNSIYTNQEIESLNKNLTTNEIVSGMGMKKRLNDINKWMNNGLIHAQNSFNRLNNLKIQRTKDSKDLNIIPNISDNYMVWCLIKDIEKYLESVEDLLMAKSFLTGMVNDEAIQTLNVNY